MRDPEGYKEIVEDDELLNIISSEVAQSQGNFLDSSELSDEREKATYEYAMQPIGHLAPQGVSKIVSSDTVEAIEGYSAVLSELLLNNKKLAKFTFPLWLYVAVTGVIVYLMISPYYV